ncbi:hypothetical protein KCU65_g4542, partial [Aureobasidium melanogenum]
MRSSIALLAASAVGALAKDTLTTSLFLGGSQNEGQQFAGSVVSVGPSDTVYELMCTDTAACGTLTLAATLTVGPSNLEYQFATETMGVEASVSESCDISGTASAVCQVTFNMEINVQDITSTSTSIETTTTLTELGMVPVVLTAGVEKLSAATPASAPASSTASASGSSKASGSGNAASSSAAGSANAASSSSTSGASSTMSSGRGGDILAFVMFSAISVSVGALMIL